MNQLEREQSILTILQSLHGLGPLKELFWSELNYDRVNQPLSRRGWNKTAANVLTEDQILFAGGGRYCSIDRTRIFQLAFVLTG